ncbi:hypothetical protein GCM10009799_41160 [Nocardiopsis rhodophaea]|uniref:Tetracyclin repressor-like C-terminal domain-containing protein n=1 Tax=Nocardiopsis rhodophaea TaxID=280238 RepID=A0ABN2TH60_9ACTN
MPGCPTGHQRPGPKGLARTPSAYHLCFKGCPIGQLTQAPAVTADPHLRKPVEETFAWLTERLAGLLEEGRASGELDDGLDPAATAAVLVAVLQGGYVLARAVGSAGAYTQVVDGALGFPIRRAGRQ